jgi:hypothetical protein
VQADTAHDGVGTEPQSVTVTAVRMVGLDEGLYALRVGEIDASFACARVLISGNSRSADPHGE